MDTSQHIGQADYYFTLLQNLNPEIKLDLISKLYQSLKNTERTPDVPLDSLFGAYQSEETAEEIIDQIRASKIFNRDIETL